ncbi:hypothetical protein SLEP1_g57145 [Rubroshorea leprosula]|uniref:Uncharacterized protein n=1 Tax=Rubroshorea leprosula TaxID=152421 RepID=A0AAV5MPV8_9ROSI|nr:hypothetical protein SLEP1_g57145 [Rubroshorea leprosula]
MRKRTQLKKWKVGGPPPSSASISSFLSPLHSPDPLHRAIIAPSHAQPSCTSPAPTPLLPALRPDRLHSAPACTLLRPALLPAPALHCTSSCALHQIACTLLALLRPTAGNDAPARPSHHQHSTPLPPCTPRLTPNPAPLHR